MHSRHGLRMYAQQRYPTIGCVKSGLVCALILVLLVSCLQIDLECLPITLHLERQAVIGTEVQLQTLHNTYTLHVSDVGCMEELLLCYMSLNMQC